MYRISGLGRISGHFFEYGSGSGSGQNGTKYRGYLSRIVLSSFWQLVELSSPSEWAPYSKHVHLNFKDLVSHVDQLFYIY